MFYDNFVRLCAQKGKSPSGVAREIGLSNAAANGWKRGKTPNDTTLAKLSDYFGVPSSELVGEVKEKPTSLSESGPAYPPKYDLLTPENREIVDRLIAGLVENQSSD